MDYARDVQLIRVSYTGELGSELHHPIAYNRHLVDTLTRVTVTLKLPSSDTSVVADEAVYSDDTHVGRITSGGGYSYFFGHDIAMALVPPQFARAGTELRVMIHAELRRAEVVKESLYDPSNAQLRM